MVNETAIGKIKVLVKKGGWWKQKGNSKHNVYFIDSVLHIFSHFSISETGVCLTFVVCREAYPLWLLLLRHLQQNLQNRMSLAWRKSLDMIVEHLIKKCCIIPALHGIDGIGWTWMTPGVLVISCCIRSNSQNLVARNNEQLTLAHRLPVGQKSGSGLTGCSGSESLLRLKLRQGLGL